MKKLFAIVAAFVILFSGCTKDSGNDVGEPSVTNTFKTNTLTLFMPSPDTMHPLYTKQKENMKIFDLIYDSLIYLGEDLSVVPQLSEGCTVSADCKSITFTLRKGITWHDGTPFTSKDAKYTFDAILAPGYEGPYRQNVAHITKVEIADDLHFTVYLDSPYARVLNLLTFPIIPSHKTDIDKIPCGTGQYKYSEYKEKEYMLLKKNTLWQLGDVPIEETVSVKILDITNDITSILNLGEISAVTLSASDLPETGIIDTMQQFAFPSLRYEFLGFNMSNIIFSQSDVRHAISAAINRQSILDDVYFGKGRIANSPIHPVAYFYNKEVDKTDYIKDKYISILRENGWADNDSNGVYDKISEDGDIYSIDATLLVNEDNKFRLNSAELIADMLSESGIRVAVEAVPWEEYCERIENGEYSMFLGGIDFSADFDFTNLLLPGNNYMNYSSEKLNKAIEKINLSVSTEEIKNAYLEFEYAFTNDMPCAGLFFTDDILLCNNRIEGVSVPSLTKPFTDINKWHFTNK